MRKIHYIVWCVVLMLLALNVTQVFSFRMSKPTTFSHPMDEKQVTKLNSLLLDLWNIDNGRQNLDIVTTDRTNADNGDIWILTTGNLARIRFQAADRTWTINPEEIQ